MDGTATGVVLGGVIGLLIAGAFGLLIGVLAKVLTPGPDPGGWFATMLLGIAGSWIGGFAAGGLGITAAVPSLIAAVLGAMLLLLTYRVFKGA
ncbi:MAG TPA: GlsB/YeaQ/YmgE family stress response membrane protein [Longimicrobiales bacterium]|nr:GlsB/YeaQ/YmgE family stress response membrane protein [Longimicrobiales bacterium]